MGAQSAGNLRRCASAEKLNNHELAFGSNDKTKQKQQNILHISFPYTQ
jgi:hypothetical protein